MKTLADHILDIVQNSVAAKATLIEIVVEEYKTDDFCNITITDNGCGMNEEELKIAANPFFTSRKTRKVGLGLPLLKQNAERSEGKFSLRSEKGRGAEVEARFRFSNIDKPPLGEIWDVFYLTMLGSKHFNLVYEYKTEKGNFRITSEEIRDSVGDEMLQNAEIREAITGLIRNNMNELQ
jgi:hypothetical protein